MDLRALIGLLAVAMLSVACGSPAEGPEPAGLGDTPAQPEPTEEPTYYYDQLLARDAIRPVYEPEFVPADQASLADEELVLGVEIGGEAKAYPISVLNFREMVNDELAGVPILATW